MVGFLRECNRGNELYLVTRRFSKIIEGLELCDLPLSYYLELVRV